MLPADLAQIRFWTYLGGLLFLLMLEMIVPYRQSSVPKSRRWLNNIGLTLINNLILKFSIAALIIKATLYVSENNLGVLNRWQISVWAKIIITVVFMDFMLYIWHFLNHELSLLWRFHRVHHSDVNMDVSTATRFHIGELAISSLIRIALIFFLGLDLMTVMIYDSISLLSTQFHHSSLKVPRWLETVFQTLFVPPSMHRIHHSVVIKERDSNYGVIFSLWDRMLGTLTLHTDQTGIKIGVGAYRKQEVLSFYRLLLMPFTRAIR
jgi:sterol desaturase/sphingolipid hydroxylase (fatty acid hydroxylase superfamily)